MYIIILGGNMNTTGDRIKVLRESKGLTQEELGKLVGTTKQTIFKYETGKIENIERDGDRSCGSLTDGRIMKLSTVPREKSWSAGANIC